MLHINHVTSLAQLITTRDWHVSVKSFDIFPDLAIGEILHQQDGKWLFSLEFLILETIISEGKNRLSSNFDKTFLECDASDSKGMKGY